MPESSTIPGARGRRPEQPQFRGLSRTARAAANHAQQPHRDPEHRNPHPPGRGEGGSGTTLEHNPSPHTLAVPRAQHLHPQRSHRAPRLSTHRTVGRPPVDYSSSIRGF
ncbi:MAG: hypothetical protein WDW36_004279 [Sanguina aurantia]